MFPSGNPRLTSFSCSTCSAFFPFHPQSVEKRSFLDFSESSPAPLDSGRVLKLAYSLAKAPGSFAELKRRQKGSPMVSTYPSRCVLAILGELEVLKGWTYMLRCGGQWFGSETR